MQEAPCVYISQRNFNIFFWNPLTVPLLSIPIMSIDFTHANWRPLVILDSFLLLSFPIRSPRSTSSGSETSPICSFHFTSTASALLYIFSHPIAKLLNFIPKYSSSMSHPYVKPSTAHNCLLMHFSNLPLWPFTTLCPSHVCGILLHVYPDIVILSTWVFVSLLNRKSLKDRNKVILIFLFQCPIWYLPMKRCSFKKCLIS